MKKQYNKRRKKDSNRNRFIVLFVAIVLVIIAIYYLFFQGHSTTSTGVYATNLTYYPNNSPITQEGKLVFIYVGAEYCPYCAAERWAIVMALSHFGNWSNLEPIYSAPPQIEPNYPNIPTYTFVNAIYKSDKIVFWEVELYNRYGNVSLQKMNSIEQQLFNTYNPSGGIPFISIGGIYFRIGSGVSPALFVGLSFQEVQQQINSKQGPIYQAVYQESQQLTNAILNVLNILSGHVILFYDNNFTMHTAFNLNSNKAYE
ncbi:MAG: DUF929 family protein [Thermoproteota archaeon]